MNSYVTHAIDTAMKDAVDQYMRDVADELEMLKAMLGEREGM
jgi:hypothetical protein